MKKLFLGLCAALVSTIALAVPGAPLKSTWDYKEVTVELVIVPENEIEKKCKEIGVPYPANACAHTHHDTKRCIIYVMPQRFQHDKERLALVGHELWHCRFGEWHDIPH